MTSETPINRAADGSGSKKKESHAAFFRQSGWIMITTVLGGVMMSGVQFLSQKIGKEEYAIFGTLLAVITIVSPIPLQMVFAQQTAAALATGRKGQLTGMIRLAWGGTFFLWLVGALVAMVFHQSIAAEWKLSNMWALPFTLLAILLSLWLPIFSGSMLGQQNFLWIGWTQMLGAVGRVGMAFLVVYVFHGKATGIIFGVMTGLLVMSGLAIWQTKDLWRGKSEAFHWGNLLRQVVPLMVGFAAFQFLFTGDVIFVKSYFTSDQSAPYMAAGTLSRAVLWLVMPLAAVMFPKIVHSAAKSEKTNLQNLVLVGTAVMSLGGILGLWLFGPIMLKIMFGKDYVSEAMTVMLWYSSAMVPFALANVLVNDLLARSRFGIVPALVVISLLYSLALTRYHSSLIMVLQTLAVFNVMLFGACAWFTWMVKPKVKSAEQETILS